MLPGSLLLSVTLPSPPRIVAPPPITVLPAGQFPLLTVLGLVLSVALGLLMIWMPLMPAVPLCPSATTEANTSCARESLAMNLDEVDQAPMFALNEIIWKSVKDDESEMPLPVHRFWFQRK